MNTKQLDEKYVANTYKRFPLVLTSGKGSRLYDENGKEYIDLGSGIAVNTFGVADEIWQQAVIKQIEKLQHTSNLYYTKPCAELAQMLCERTGMKKVFFSNSGAEANECAIKVARKFAADKKGKDYFTIVTLENSFHGRTITTLSATGQAHYHETFQPLTEGFVHVKANDFEQLKALCESKKIAAIMFECVQGEGGVIPLDAAYVKKVEQFAKQNDILLIADEVQTGNGRSGKLYAYMNFDITPDIVSTAKGLAGGLPLGATLLGEKVETTLGFGDHGSTFGANPVSCSAAISVLSRIDDKLLAEVQEKSKLIFETLKGAKGIESVSGMGLMLGIKTQKAAGDFVARCMELGVLCLTAKDKVRLLPALNIPLCDLTRALEIIKQVAAQ